MITPFFSIDVNQDAYIQVYPYESIKFYFLHPMYLLIEPCDKSTYLYVHGNRMKTKGISISQLADILFYVFICIWNDLPDIL